MTGNATFRDATGSHGHDNDLTGSASWYHALSLMFPGMVLVADKGRISAQIDIEELKRRLPTSALIRIQEANQLPSSTATAPATPEDLQYQTWLALPLHAQLAEVSAALSLNKTQLAEVLDVSRPTVYQWMDERRVAVDDRTDTSRLITLLKLMAQAGISGTEALNARFTKVPLRIHGQSLLAMLFEQVWDEASVLAGLAQARDLTRNARQVHLDREARLQAEGFVPPSASEREANLERNLFLEGLDTL